MASLMPLHVCSINPSPRLSACRNRRHHHHHRMSSTRPGGIPAKVHHGLCGRRLAAVAALTTAFLAKQAISDSIPARCLDLRFTAPDQTREEAYAGVEAHARELLEIKPLVESQSWRELQAALRKSSSYLKQDLYTIIQARPGGQRPHLRKLYSNLFNNVSRLDYAARRKEAMAVEECYNNIVAAIDEIFTMI